jgi:hypothetical protein
MLPGEDVENLTPKYTFGAVPPAENPPVDCAPLAVAPPITSIVGRLDALRNPKTSLGTALPNATTGLLRFEPRVMVRPIPFCPAASPGVMLTPDVPLSGVKA